MKLLAVVGSFVLITVAAALVIDNATSGTSRCATGNIRGFAVVRGDPRLGSVGGIPNRFTDNPGYFGIRYNCATRGVFAKRVDEGVYDVWFPGNPARVVQATALTSGASASAVMISNEVFRVSIRGPLVRNSILAPLDTAFQVTVG